MDEANRQSESNPPGSAPAAAPAAASPPGASAPSAAESPKGPVIHANGTVSGDLIVAALKNCYDPEVPVNIYDMGLIYVVDIGPANDVAVQMTLTAPNCPAAQILPADVRNKVEAVEGVNSAEVAVTFDPPWTPDHMNDAAKLTLNIL